MRGHTHTQRQVHIRLLCVCGAYFFRAHHNGLERSYGAPHVTCRRKKNYPWQLFCNLSPQFINRTHEFCSLGLTNRAHGLINRTHEFPIRALRFCKRTLGF